MTLTRQYKLFNALLFSNKYYGIKVQSFRRKIRILCGYLYGNTYESEPGYIKAALINKTKKYVCDELFFHHVDKKHYEKYNPEFSLSTWIEQYIYLNINNLIGKHRPRSGFEGINSRSDLCDPENAKFRQSYEEFEDWLNISTSMENPETLLQQKELLTLAIKHFGIEDLRVLLGIDSKKSTIQKRKLNYDQYTKRLYLKKLAFVPVVKSNGYEFY